MNTARVLADPQPIIDENTLITDYWLSFMSARLQEEKCEPQPRTPDLELKVEDLRRDKQGAIGLGGLLSGM